MSGFAPSFVTAGGESQGSGSSSAFKSSDPVGDGNGKFRENSVDSDSDSSDWESKLGSMTVRRQQQSHQSLPPPSTLGVVKPPNHPSPPRAGVCRGFGASGSGGWSSG